MKIYEKTARERSQKMTYGLTDKVIQQAKADTWEQAIAMVEEGIKDKGAKWEG
jgi:hypothetical protein